jgi:hypothetical protein
MFVASGGTLLYGVFPCKYFLSVGKQSPLKKKRTPLGFIEPKKWHCREGDFAVPRRRRRNDNFCPLPPYFPGKFREKFQDFLLFIKVFLDD